MYHRYRFWWCKTCKLLWSQSSDRQCQMVQQCVEIIIPHSSLCLWVREGHKRAPGPVLGLENRHLVLCTSVWDVLHPPDGEIESSCLSKRSYRK